MKRNSCLPLALLICITAIVSVGAQTRVASFGSNPDFSVNLFPQDVSQQHSNALIFFPSYCKSPWWGDIDEVTNKPSGAVYTITGSEISDGEAFFRESAKLHTSSNIFGYSYRPSDKLTGKFDLNYTIAAMRDRAEGNFTNNIDTSFIPFDYSLRHTLNSFTFGGLFGFSLRNIPVGLKLKLGLENTLALNQNFTFTKGDTLDITTNRALWGWSTVGCSHIFGVRGTEGDAWLQNSYSKGPLFSLDLTGGASLSKIKAGFNMHFKAGRQNNYSWQQDTSVTTNDSIIDRNFIGNYVKNNWAKKSHLGEMNVYGNFNWISGEMFGVHTFFQFGYSGSVVRNALSENLDVESDTKESKRGIILEADPNINIKLGPSQHFIDIGLLFQYGFHRANNTYLRWIGGGSTRTYWNTSISNELDENVWENFSYANNNVFNAGIDLSAMFPLMNNTFGSLGFGLTLFGNVKNLLQTKYFGENSDSGSENIFTLNDKRINYTREGILSTILMLDYVINRLNVRLEVTEPILRSLTTSTTKKDADGNNTGYHKKDPLWLSLRGLQVGAFVSWDFRFSFLKYN